MSKKIMILFLLLTLSFQSNASCLGEYQKKITEINGRMNPPRTTVITNTGAEVVVVTTLACAGVLSVGAAIALPAAALAAGTYLVILSKEKKSFMNVKLLLQQAEKRTGPVWKKFVSKFDHKRSSTDPELIRETLLRLDSELAFCQENLNTGKIELKHFKAVRKMVRAELI